MQVRVSSSRDPEPLALDAFERLGAFVLRLEEVPDSAELSIAVVDVAEMAHLSEKYRGVPGPTDVLSFGCDEPCAAGSDEPITLGDVIIAPEIAQKQSEEMGTTVEAELNLLLVHGVLHLLGYVHEEEESERAMRAREESLLSAWADQS